MLGPNKNNSSLYKFNGTKGSRRPSTNKRYRDFIFFPFELSSLSEYSQIQLLEYATNTFKMLQATQASTYPFPIPVTTEEASNPNSLSTCKDMILNEKQHIPTFHFVGHGGQNFIGTLDDSMQLSPEELATNLSNYLEENGLAELANKSLCIIFHICNSAYVPVSSNDKPEDILEKITQNSFIGQFYKAFKNRHPGDLEVTGYRGFYTALTSKNAGTAYIQNSYENPTVSKSSDHGAYTLSKQGCKPHFSLEHNAKDLYFPVETSIDTQFDQLCVRSSNCKP